jgi:hypothetical protein
MTVAVRSEATVRRLARTAGMLYLILGVLTGFAGTVLPGMYAAGDAAATVGSLAANAATVRYAVVADLAGGVAWVLLALVLANLLAGVGREAARALLVFTALGAGIMMFNAVFAFEAMRVAAGTAGLPLSGGSRALVLVLSDLHHYGSSVAMVFFGLWLLPLGLLAWRSAGMLPRWLGVALVAGGVCYLVTLTAAFLAPDLWRAAHSAVLLVPAAAEVAAVGYLLLIGARPQAQHRPALEEA